MEDQAQILKEIKELKSIVARVIGLPDSPPENQFSIEALDKAAKEFQKLSIERGEWVNGYDIKKYIKGASYNPGKFIIQEFEFSNYFKRGQALYFNKQDLIALGKELKERNIDLKRYEELREDQLKFKKYLESASENAKGKKAFKLPRNLKDITTSAPPMPPVEELRAEVKKLRAEFLQYKLAEYIDVYKDSYAMTKFLYYHTKYIDSETKRRINRWVTDFNNVHHLLKECKAKKEKFIPVKDDDMIQL